MSDSARGQLVRSAAEVYEEFFLPALFQEWPARLVDAALIEKGSRVLDVACGTGVLARTAQDRVGSDGSVVGIDINEDMLAVAEQKAPHIEWRCAPAEKLPFYEDTFDAVVSQFGLMFFTDQRKALTEMGRVLRPGKSLAVAVWDSIANTPGYAAMTALLARLFGNEVAAALEAPYSLGDKNKLQTLFTDAGLHDVTITTRNGTARFPSLQAWVHTDIKGWTLADVIDDEQYQRLLKEAEQALKPFVTDAGAVSFPAPAHIITWRKSE